MRLYCRSQPCHCSVPWPPHSGTLSYTATVRVYPRHPPSPPIRPPTSSSVTTDINVHRQILSDPHPALSSVKLHQSSFSHISLPLRQDHRHTAGAGQSSRPSAAAMMTSRGRQSRGPPLLTGAVRHLVCRLRTIAVNLAAGSGRVAPSPRTGSLVDRSRTRRADG